MRIDRTDARYDQTHEDKIAGLSWSMTNGSLRHYEWCPIRQKTVNAFSLAELVWRLSHGETIKRFRHLNGNRLDCRLANLRPAMAEATAERPRRRRRGNPPSPCPKPEGGKHAAPATEGEVRRTAEQILGEWLGWWDPTTA
jgi:hypothetical protein